MSDNNKYENKSEKFLEKQEALKLTEEDLEQVTGGVGPKRINTSPQLIVDGVSMLGGLDCINPADVVSMEILKDASAAAIYGTHGAN